MDDEREFCAVPGCDEQPYPGDLLCETHQQEDNPRERGDDDGLGGYSDPRDEKDERRNA
jgi:hypothetical protein